MPLDKPDQHRPAAAHTSPFSSSFFSPAKLPVRSKNPNSVEKPDPTVHDPSKAKGTCSQERQVQGSGTASKHTKPSPVRAPFLP